MLESHSDIPCFLEIKSGSQDKIKAECEQKLLLELFGRDAIWVIRWRSESDREIAKGNVEEGLYVAE